MSIVVGIATCGRRELLGEAVRELGKQTRLPDLLVVCPAEPGDVDLDLLQSQPIPYKLARGARGSSHQRNAILREIDRFDAIVFFDDDFFPSTDYLESVEAILTANPDIVAMSGTPIADGVNGPGLSPEQGREYLLAASRLPMKTGSALAEDYGTYGCNMVFRLAPVREQRIEFDENLPMYGWQEDIDFSRQLAPWGKIVRPEALTGVHLGVKRGRTSGVKFGYSQVANPIYLIGKGTVSLSFGGKTLVKNLIANLMRAWRPEPYIDRVGRLKGNAFALMDLLMGRLSPSRIFELD
jgi:GT2 family glycosyltransferase